MPRALRITRVQDLEKRSLRRDGVSQGSIDHEYQPRVDMKGIAKHVTKRYIPKSMQRSRRIV